MLKISVRDVTSNGLVLSEKVDQAAIGLSDNDVQYLSPIAIKAKVERVENTILAHVTVDGDFSLVCARCLEDVKEKKHQEFDFDYPIEKGVEFIELGEDIRQELILNLPTRVLCKADCKGLCPSCGGNLNGNACKCSVKKF